MEKDWKKEPNTYHKVKADLVSKKLQVIIKKIEEYSKSSVLVSSSVKRIGLNELIDILFAKVDK